MNKVSKISITLVVFVLVIIYFLKFAVKVEIDYCSNFDEKLSESIELYFLDALPENVGDVKEASIDDLISNDLITLSDVEEIGSNCSGNIYATKGENNQYYYYNDVTCGTCEVGSKYTSWSDWDTTLPDFGTNRSQVQVKVQYNYTDGEAKLTDWSDWGESIEKIKSPTIPTSAETLEKETEEKTQYSSRDKTYQWYKLSENLVYYNNGAYSKTIPATGYTKLDSSKKVEKTTSAYESEAVLKSSEGLNSKPTPDYDVIQVSGYKVKTPKYIYSKTIKSCPTYTCQKEVKETVTTQCFAATSSAATSQCSTAGLTNCSSYSETYYKTADVAESSSDALSACKSKYSSLSDLCKTYSSSSYSKKIYSLYVNFNGNLYIDFKNNGNYVLKACRPQLNFSTYEFPNSTYKTACDNKDENLDFYNDLVINFSSYGGKGKDDSEEALCKITYTYDGDLSTVWYKMKTGLYNGQNPISEINGVYNCDYSSNGTKTITKYGYYLTAYGYKGTKTTYSTYSSNGKTEFVSCPSDYPISNSTGKYETSSESCTGSKSTTYYLKSDGTTTTNSSEASQLTEAEYNALKSKNSSLSSYTKGSVVGYNYGNLTEGNCPSGYICSTQTMYKAEIYTYKWYKKSEAVKEYCNNKKYSATSPATGCEKDLDTIKYTDWSDWSDKEIKSTDTREVKTQKLVRYRIKYIDKSSLLLDEWLSLDEFEEKIGKSIDEFTSEGKYIIQQKVLYKYRTKQ